MNADATTAARAARARVAAQFELEAVRLGLSLVRTLSHGRYLLYDPDVGRELVALVLVCSADFFEYRVNLQRRRLDLLVVARHNAVVPLRVVSLSQVMSYPPLTVPTIERTGRKHRNHEEVMLLVSKLLLNFESAWQEVNAMPQRTRQWYLQQRDRYLQPRVGRPWAS